MCADKDEKDYEPPTPFLQFGLSFFSFLQTPFPYGMMHSVGLSTEFMSAFLKCNEDARRIEEYMKILLGLSH
jgi:hypothetical protein